MTDDVEALVETYNPKVRAIASAVFDWFTGPEGCDSYVKTIYIGFTWRGEMVAAAYPHADHVEVALALAEDHDDCRLVDATHLTWRTMPVSIPLRNREDVKAAQPLFREAAERIRLGEHGVNREPEYFMGERKRISRRFTKR